MDAFEDWMDRVPALAVREFAGADHNLRTLPVGDVRAIVLSTPAFRAVAEESWRIETEGRARVAAMCPREVRDRKLRYGLVD